MRENTVNLKGEEEKQSQHPEIPSAILHPQKKKSRSRMVSAIAIGIAVIVCACLWSFISAGFAWRAVFLANNQVYFGHFWEWPFESTVKLTDVYYLQVAPPGQQLSGQDQSQLKLVKLGNEIHGPTSEMVIPISQILFWETLRPTSVIVKTIENGQSQN
jgi:hypothetical protein